ncbi:MAG: type II 3-dehydroquinate dehydratase [Candidatus Omnitrophica bacterium]|nr:type II 3-dehydroquinate dehydratase [Candidatus Omnitrophota bacterium]MDD5429749.1 type II 3-dehydroquinate dehydratase [Candidatus Omnitrophota bacterium]
MKTNKKVKILVIHGPNLHLLGKRQPDIYGKFTLEEINKELKQEAKKSKIELQTIQSNSEGDIVEAITKGCYDVLIINPAAYTHTSVAIRDALLGVEKPAIEIHLSNIYKREDFRKKSLVSDVVMGTISGFGKTSYTLALEAAINFLQEKQK